MLSFEEEKSQAKGKEKSAKSSKVVKIKIFNFNSFLLGPLDTMKIKRNYEN